MFANTFVRGDRILDVACGKGYGSFLFSLNSNAQVYGLDLSREKIDFAKENFKSRNLEFHEGDACGIDFQDNFFTSVVSIETIEHLKDHDNFLLELKRVLKKDGILVISSPDKIVKDRFFDNPHHINLLYKNELSALLKKHFNVIGVYCQTPLIIKPYFMIYLSMIFSCMFLSAKIVKDRDYLTGTNCIFICEAKP